jgi:hypothetical protein
MADDTLVAETDESQVTEEEEESSPDLEEEESDAPEDDKGYIRISRVNIHKEIERLQSEDPEFANAFNTQVGRKAASRSTPIIQELEARNRILERQAKTADLRAMDPKEIEQRFNSDPEFAREYTELVHNSEATAQAEMEAAQMSSVLSQIVDEASDMGLSADEIESFVAKAKAGEYDADPSGRKHHWGSSLVLLQRDMQRAATTKRRPVARSTEEDESEENENLKSPGPDTSSSQSARPARKPRYRNATEAAALFAEGRISTEDYIKAKAELGW